MEAVARENYKSSALTSAEILAFAIGCTKKVGVSESGENARVAYLGERTNMGSGRVRKL